MNPTRFPLQWPAGWKRTPAARRRRGQFRRGKDDMTVFAAAERVLAELYRLDGVQPDDMVLSTNLRTRLDGMPRSDQPRPEDPGVAVYWQPPIGPMRCMAVDVYTDVAQNIAAIAATLEAMRAIERHGGAVIMDRAFAGFTALPPPIAAGMKRDWQIVLGLQELLLPKEEDVERAYRRLAGELHPDRAVDEVDRQDRTRKMAELNVARDEALEFTKRNPKDGK